jgi:hypothetical protein
MPRTKVSRHSQVVKSLVVLTVVLPELVVRHAWQQVLQANVTRRIRRALRWEPGIIITTVPFRLYGGALCAFFPYG